MRNYLVSTDWREDRAEYTIHKIIKAKTAREAAQTYDPSRKITVSDPTERISRFKVRLLPKNVCLDRINTMLFGQKPLQDKAMRKLRTCYYD